MTARRSDEERAAEFVARKGMGKWWVGGIVSLMAEVREEDARVADAHRSTDELGPTTCCNRAGWECAAAIARDIRALSAAPGPKEE